MGRKRLYLPGTQVLFVRDDSKRQNLVISRKDGKCKWCGLVMRKSALSTHVPACRDRHKRIREPDPLT